MTSTVIVNDPVMGHVQVEADSLADALTLLDAHVPAGGDGTIKTWSTPDGEGGRSWHARWLEHRPLQVPETAGLPRTSDVPDPAGPAGVPPSPSGPATHHPALTGGGR